MFIGALVTEGPDRSLRIEPGTMRTAESQDGLLALMLSEVMRENQDVIAVWEFKRENLELGRTITDSARKWARSMYPTRLMSWSSWGEFLELHAKYMKRIELQGE